MVVHRADNSQVNFASGIPGALKMLFGMYLLPPSKNRAQVGHYLMQRVKDILPILGFDEDAGRWQAEQRARLTAAGKTPSLTVSGVRVGP